MKKVILLRFFEKFAETILINKIEQNHGGLAYKKTSKHRQNYILRDINYSVKMFVSTLPNIVCALAQKLL